MREVKAVYGGELSAHHYFRDFYFCDSGMIPWLLIAELMSKSDKKLSELLNGRAARFAVSKEVNIETDDTGRVIKTIKEMYANVGRIQELDGISVEFDDWRFNLRASNTEPMLRLNVESRGNEELCRKKTEELREALLKL